MYQHTFSICGRFWTVLKVGKGWYCTLVIVPMSLMLDLNYVLATLLLVIQNDNVGNYSFDSLEPSALEVCQNYLKTVQLKFYICRHYWANIFITRLMLTCLKKVVQSLNICIKQCPFKPFRKDSKHSGLYQKLLFCCFVAVDSSTGTLFLYALSLKGVLFLP